MCSFEIDLRILRAVANAASTDTKKYYLRGVHVEPLDGRVHMVATDGYILLAARAETECKAAPSFIVPTELIKRLKLKNTKPQIGVIAQSGDSVTIDFDGAGYTSKTIDGCFPDWRRVFPRYVDGKASHYDVGIYAQLVSAAKALGVSSKQIAITQCDGSPALVNIPAVSDKPVEITGLIMPMRQQNALKAAPSWCVS